MPQHSGPWHSKGTRSGSALLSQIQTPRQGLWPVVVAEVKTELGGLGSSVSPRLSAAPFRPKAGSEETLRKRQVLIGSLIGSAQDAWVVGCSVGLRVRERSAVLRRMDGKAYV